MTDTVTIMLEISLVAFVVMFPEDTLDLMEDVRIGFLLWRLNLVMRVREYMIYRKLKQAFAEIGMQMPPFVYVPIQERDFDR